MTVVLLTVLALVGLAIVLYVMLFPRHAVMIISRANGGRLSFSRTRISLEPPPDRYPVNGLDHIEPYVARLLAASPGFKSLLIHTPDGERGFGLHARDCQVDAALVVDWRDEPEREKAIRSFFEALGIAPSVDYLAGNGPVPDATRVLSYPLPGDAHEVTALTKRILQELCGVSPTEGLNIQYSEVKHKHRR